MFNGITIIYLYTNNFHIKAVRAIEKENVLLGNIFDNEILLYDIHLVSIANT